MSRHLCLLAAVASLAAFAAPAVTHIYPLTGPASTQIAVSGTGLSDVQGAAVGGVPASFIVQGDQLVYVFAPSASGPVTVSGPTGMASSSASFSLIPSPAITSVSPMTGGRGAMVVITGTNLDGVTSVQFGGGIEAGGSVTAQRIDTTVPPGARTGVITLTAPGGTASSGLFTVTATVAPVVTGFNPTSGGTFTNVQISGSNFTGVSVVKFNGVDATSFTVSSDTQLRALVPPGQGSGIITVFNAAGVGMSSAVFTRVPEPVVSGLSPDAGAPGRLVTLTGTDLMETNLVTLGGVSAPFTATGTTVSATVPEGAVTGDWTVFTSGGFASRGPFTVLSAAAPMVTGFAPQAGAAGAVVDVQGTRFTGTSQVTLNGTAAEFMLAGDRDLWVTVPAGATSGAFRVTNTLGSSSSPSAFTVLPAPQVSSLSITSGPPGTVVTVQGIGLGTVSAVYLGGVSQPFFPIDATRVSLVVTESAKSGPVRVDTEGGSATSAATFTVTALGVPAVSGFSPAKGAWGAQVTLNGTNFSGATAVQFGGATATLFSVQSNSVLTAWVPSGAPTGPITVFNGRGQGASAGTFTVTPPPRLAAFAPMSAGLGATVTVTGSGFTSATALTFGGTAASFRVDSDAQLTATVPPGALSGPLRVETAGGASTSAANFTVTASAAPLMVAFSPAVGTPFSTVTLVGARFTGVTAVRFNGVAAEVQSGGSDALLRVTVPELATSGPISVVNSAGTATSAAAFTVLPPAALTSFTPGSGGEGTTVVIRGSSLAGTTSLVFGPRPAVFTVDSATQLTAAVPSGATTAPIAVFTAAGFASTTNSFVVTPGGAPVVTGFSPASGGLDAGVTLTGRRFTGATSVTLAGAPVASFTVRSDAQLELVTPTPAASGPFTVWSGTQSGTSAASFTVLSPPVISGFSPGSGAPGADVTVSGANLGGATAVRFNGARANFTAVSATQLIAQVPAATSGLISVETPGGTATSASSFLVDATAAPTLTGFAPPSGGGGTAVRLTGSHFSGATDVQLGGHSVPFALIDDFGLTVTIPSGAASGAFSVLSSQGTATSSAMFTVVPTPVLASFSPLSGGPGTAVTLTGTDLALATRVELGGGALASFTAAGGQLTATVPAGARTGPLTVVTPGGSASTTLAFAVTAAGAPAITSLVPSSGGVGAAVTVNGSGLSGTQLVTIGGVVASFAVAGDQLLVFTVPPGAATGTVSVATGNGMATSGGSFTVLPAPVISSISPFRGAVGAPVDIRGTDLGGATAVTFSGRAAMITSKSSTNVRVTVPLGAASGPIAVVTPAGTAISASAFEVQGGAPSISGFTPSSGAALSRVSITGAGFSGAQWVTVGGVATGFALLDDTLIEAEVPAGASGQIAVATAGGVATSSASFTVRAPPVISSMSITEGPAGADVQLDGSGFTGATRVELGGVSAAAFTVASDSSLTVTVPGGARSGFITVTAPGGAGSSTQVFTVTSLVAPVVMGVMPSSGGVGSSVTVIGMGFTAASVVTLNGAAVDFVPTSDTRLGFTVAAGATTGRVGVVGPAGTATSATDFTVLPAPLLLGFTPAAGRLGTSVTLTGRGFQSAVQVSFGAQAASFTVVNDGQLTATVPAGATTGLLTVTTRAGASTSAQPFTVLGAAAPTVASFTPASGGASTQVTVTGTGFTGATAVTFAGASAAFTVRDDTSLVATVPPGAATGPIAVTTSAGTGASSTSFMVVAVPFVGSFFPAMGTTSTQVTVFGRGFTGANAVRFNRVSGAFTVASDTQLTVTVPPGATTGPISVTVAAGTGTSAGAFVVNSTAAPVVTGFLPGAGPPGAAVTVRGSGFTGATAVAFNGAPAQFSTSSDTQLTATVPAGATSGPISVTNTLGSAVSAMSFTVGAGPALTGFSPASGRVGTPVTVTGSGLAQAQSLAFNAVAAVIMGGGSDTQLGTTVPVGATSGPISVTTPFGTAMSAMSFTVEGAAPPTVSSVQPASGSVEGGTLVQVKGLSFESGASVTFGGLLANTTYVDAMTLNSRTPAHAAGAVDVVVTNPDAGSGTLAGGFTYAVIADSGMGGGGEPPVMDGGAGGGAGGGEMMSGPCGCGAAPGLAIGLVTMLLLRRRRR